ncbi:MAG: hypothetical protein QOI35_1121, partial [Cryptosporangiaceae bacterium]|nr:hypothetical protein [Cryptosporangiaceae bacterium]
MGTAPAVERCPAPNEAGASSGCVP